MAQGHIRGMTLDLAEEPPHTNTLPPPSPSPFSPSNRKKSAKESGLEIASVWGQGDGKVATRLGTSENIPFSLLSFVATMESEILFSSGLS